MTQAFIQRSFFAILFIVISMTSCSDDVQPAPVISSYSPTSGFSGGTVTISGENFGSNFGAVKVYFYDGAEAALNEVTNTTINVTIPSDAYVGPITVRVKEMETEGAEFTVLTMCHIGGDTFLPCNRVKSEGPK